MSSTQTITATEVPVTPSNSVPTKLNYVYIPPGVSKPAFYPGTASGYRRPHDAHDVNITDVRGSEDKFELDREGFKFMQYPRGEQDIVNEEKVKTNLYPDIIDLLKKT